MEFIVGVSFPLKPFNTPCPLGHGWEKIGAVEPKAIYFTGSGAGHRLPASPSREQSE